MFIFSLIISQTQTMEFVCLFINFHLCVQIFQSCKLIWDLKTKLFFTLYLSLSIWNLCDLCLLNASLFLTFATTRWSLSQSAGLNDPTTSTFKCLRLSTRIWSIWLWVFPSGDITSIFMDVAMWEHHTFYSEVFRWGKIYWPNSIIITDFV
jgi:hypothetical protein